MAICQYNLGLLLGEMGEWSAARASYEAALAICQRLAKLDPSVTDYATGTAHRQLLASVHNSLGKTLVELGDLDEAIEELCEAVWLDPDSDRSSDILGDILMELDNPGRVIVPLREAIRHEPDRPKPYRSLGLVLRSVGDPVGAVEVLRGAIRLAPGDVAAHELLADALLSLGRHQEVLDAYGDAGRLEPSIAGSRRIAEDLIRARAVTGSAAGAAEEAGELIEATPEARAYHSERSKLITRLVQDDALFHALTQARPDDTQLWTCRGRDRACRGDFAGAAADYAQVMERCPPSEEWYEHAALRLLVGDAEGYQHAVDRMIEHAEDSDDPFLAYVLARSAGLATEPPVEPGRTVAWAERAVDSGRFGYYLHTSGLALYRAGRLQEAIERLEQSTQSSWGTNVPSPNNLVLAMTRHELGQEAEARRLLNEALVWGERKERAIRAGVENNKSYATDWLEFSVLRREAEALILDDIPLPEDVFAPAAPDQAP